MSVPRCSSHNVSSMGFFLHHRLSRKRAPLLVESETKEIHRQLTLASDRDHGRPQDFFQEN